MSVNIGITVIQSTVNKSLVLPPDLISLSLRALVEVRGMIHTSYRLTKLLGVSALVGMLAGSAPRCNCSSLAVCFHVISNNVLGVKVT